MYAWTRMCMAATELHLESVGRWSPPVVSIRMAEGVQQSGAAVGEAAGTAEPDLLSLLGTADGERRSVPSTLAPISIAASA